MYLSQQPSMRLRTVIRQAYRLHEHTKRLKLKIRIFRFLLFYQYQSYLARNNFELIYEKSGTALNEGVQYSNISNSTTSSISQNLEKSSGSVKNSLSEEQETNINKGNIKKLEAPK